MSQVIYELLDSRGHDGDVRGNKATTREYLVLLPTNAIVITPSGLDLEGPSGSTIHLPGTGEPHPWMPGLTVDQVQVTPAGVNTSRVSVRYSSDRRYVPPDTVDQTDEEFDTYSAGWVYARIEVPFLTLGYYDTGDALIAVWDGNVWETNEPRLVREREVNITSLSQVTLNVIDAQVGKVHEFDGNRYQFMASDIFQVGNGVWRVKYSWTRDKGTARPTDWIDDIDRKYPGAPELPYVNEPAAGLLRDPFHDLRVIRGQDIEVGSGTYAAQVIQIPNADLSDLNGWQTLPGLF